MAVIWAREWGLKLPAAFRIAAVIFDLLCGDADLRAVRQLRRLRLLYRRHRPDRRVDDIGRHFVPGRETHRAPDAAGKLSRIANLRVALPKGIVFIDALPMTTTGKIQKARLRQRYEDLYAEAVRADAAVRALPRPAALTPCRVGARGHRPGLPTTGWRRPSRSRYQRPALRSNSPSSWQWPADRPRTPSRARWKCDGQRSTSSA